MTGSFSFPTPRGTRNTQREIYKQEYGESKKGGEPFFPHTIAKDAAVSLAVFLVVLGLAIFVPVQTEPVADPTSTTYNPRPEWYFLYLFEFLKYFPGYMEPVVAVILPGLLVILVFSLPFIDRRRERHLLQRPIVSLFAALVIGGIAFLSIKSAMAPQVATPHEDPLVIQGKQAYTKLQCTYCHSINGVGGAVGPDLAVATKNLSEERITQYLRDPHAMIPQSLHPKLQFTEDELAALSAFVSDLGKVPEFSSEAPELFAKNCSSCHAIRGQGGKVGPDLSNTGDVRSVAFLIGFIASPQSVLPGSSMPAFDKTLSGAQISDLANYLAAQRGGPPPVTTPPSTTPAR
ncbi:MAG: c-type cytochrome [Chloroflexi bacterium]|nr:c-type cytochrome [Chloroflexota bacterium]